MRVEKSYCRLCSGLCGMLVSIDDDQRVVDVRGDHDHPMTMGYACIKGLQAPHVHHGESRLLHPLKRMPDGRFEPIPLEQALDEIAERLRAILAQHEPRAVAAFRGTQAYLNSCAYPIQPAFLAALGSPSFFSTATIDQSAKFVSAERLGSWEAGWQPIDTCDVWMAFGFNPLVSVQALMGFHTLNPSKRMQQLKASGVKFILVDPRRTEMARYADIHLQPYPGEDVAVAAGLLHIILKNGWQDDDFLAGNANGLEALKLAVAAYTPEMVAHRAGIDAADLIAAAELFARQSRRGFVTSGTGPSMGPHSNLAVHLLDALNVVCGRFKREGEPVPNPGVFIPRRAVRAQARSPRRSWQHGAESRVGEYSALWGEMMSNTLADEILKPGPGQIRSLFVVGGNPLSALPDQRKAVEAFKQLDLLVTIDPVMSNTARLSHYVLPPKILYEREDMTNLFETAIYPQAFAQHTPSLVPPPAGSDVQDDWYIFWGIAKRLGLTLSLNGQPLNMAQAPSTRELLEIMAAGSQIPLTEIAGQPAGKVFPVEPQFVAAPDERTGRFELAPNDVQAELQAVAREPVQHGAYLEDGQRFTHLLCVRRLRDVINSAMRDAPAIRKRTPYNTAQLHPDDIAALELCGGERVEISSAHGRIQAVLEADATLKRGIVTLPHGWGGLPGDDRYETEGASVNLLISANRHIETINAMARMTAVPVNIARVMGAEPRHDSLVELT